MPEEDIILLNRIRGMVLRNYVNYIDLPSHLLAYLFFRVFVCWFGQN